MRVVHRWFADSDDRDQEFEGHSYGWAAFFRNLRLYLAHFSGQPSATIQLTGFAPGPKAIAWSALNRQLCLPCQNLRQRIGTSNMAPSLAGIVERVGEVDHPEELMLRLDQPTTGIAHLFAMPMGGLIPLSVRFYLYGPQASAVAGSVEPEWQAWIMKHFPAPGDPASMC